MSTIEHEADHGHDHGHEGESHALPPALVAHQQRRAIMFFILADAIFFACMLFSFFYLRALDVQGGWIPDNGSVVPAWLSWLLAGVMVLGALAHRSAEAGLSAGVKSRFQTGALAALVLLVVNIGLMFYQAHTWPIMMSEGSYASVFILMWGTQLVHAFMLLFVALGIWVRGNQGKFDNGNVVHATVAGYFWYWVTATAIISALTTFFVP